MDWLKDKKNQPVIAIVAAVVIVGVLFFVLRPMIFGGSSTTAAAPDSGTSPMPTYPSEVAPSADASATPAQPVQTAQVSTGVTPMEPWRADPFLPVGYKPPKKERVRKLPIVDFPFPRIPMPPKERDDEQVQDVVQPARRMAGLLLNNRVYAIIETNGSSEIVQPGDTLKDRLAVVEKIEQDKVILKTTGKKPGYIVVRMAASPRTDIAAGADTSTRSPGGGVRSPMSPMSPMPPMPGGRSRNRM